MLHLRLLLGPLLPRRTAPRSVGRQRAPRLPPHPPAARHARRRGLRIPFRSLVQKPPAVAGFCRAVPHPIVEFAQLLPRRLPAHRPDRQLDPAARQRRPALADQPADLGSGLPDGTQRLLQHLVFLLVLHPRKSRLRPHRPRHRRRRYLDLRRWLGPRLPAAGRRSLGAGPLRAVDRPPPLASPVEPSPKRRASPRRTHGPAHGLWRPSQSAWRSWSLG